MVGNDSNFNGTRYLQQTLESVLAQDQGADNMQIEVIDDCSTTDDPEAIVKRVGQGRISFYRNPKTAEQSQISTPAWNVAGGSSFTFFIKTIQYYLDFMIAYLVLLPNGLKLRSTQRVLSL